MIVVATAEEYKEARKQFKHQRIIITGVGPGNIYRSLRRIPRWRKIINFGFAGSNKILKGLVVKVRSCKHYHPNCTYEEESFVLGRGDVTCYTSNDFVLQTEIEEPVVFDMELYYILSMGYKKVKSIKIVSDNLDYNEYENTIRKEGK